MSYLNRKNFQREWNTLFNKQFKIGPLPNAAEAERETNSKKSRDELTRDDQLNTPKKQLGRAALLKIQLNNTKSLLNDYDIKIWRDHTNFTNLCSGLSKFIKKTINAELCTQAWLKFATIINTYDVIPSASKEGMNAFASLHLCEAPGAFICCLNNFLLQKHPQLQWNWVASTLNPYYEGNDVGIMINDDRLIKETLDRWDFGADFSGNIMDINNLRTLKERCARIGKIHLVTADGSIDCSDVPCEQEAIVAPLLYWEVITALNILCDGGNFVVKLFTVLEPFTTSIIYILFCAFGEVHFCKPGPSKPGNSEVYVICKNYHGYENVGSGFMETIMKSTITCNYADPLVPIESMPGAFLDRLIACEEFFIGHQTDAIQSNIKTFKNISKGKRRFTHHAKEFICQEFITKLDLKSIDSKNHVGYSQDKLQSCVESNYTKEHSHNFHAGTLYERQLNKTVHWSESITHQGAENTEAEISDEHQWYSSLEGECLTLREISEWKPILGKPFKTCKSTQFCSNYLMMDLFKDRKDMLGKLSTAKASNASKTSTVLDELEEVELLVGDMKYEMVAVTKMHQNSEQISMGIFGRKSLKASVKEFFRICEFPCSSRSEGGPQQTDDAVKTDCFNKDGGILTAIMQGPCYFEVCQSAEINESRSSSVTEDEQPESEITKLIDASGFNEIPRVTQSCKTIEDIIENGVDEKLNALVCSASLDKETAHRESSQKLLLLYLILTIRILRSEGVLVCKIDDIFSNFNGGILNILSKLFTKITIFKPTSKRQVETCSSKFSTRYIVCCGFKGGNEALVQYLWNVLQMQTDASQVIHLLPIPNILEKTFFDFLKDTNEKHVKLEISSIRDVENQLQTNN